MAHLFVVEDGTGTNSDANAYWGTAGQADDYFDNLNRKDAWRAYTNNARLGALIAASEYMDQLYRDRYVGDIQASTIDTQGLLWPRDNVPNARTGILEDAQLPLEIREAAAEFAIAYLDNGGTLHGTNDPEGPTVTESEVEVTGAVRKREKFSGGGVAPRRRRYPRAEAKLAPYITSTQQRVLRA